MKLEQGKWYKWPGEHDGVALVEKLGEGMATVKVVTGQVVDTEFTTADGEEVSFSSMKTKRTVISPTSALEPAPDDYVARFVKSRRTLPSASAAEGPTKHANIGHGVELDPLAKTKKKKRPCSYSRPKSDGGGRCDRPAPYRVYWYYDDGTKSFCRACKGHAQRFAERHDIELPERPTKGGSKR